MISTRDEIGKQVELNVASWRDPRGIQRTGFEAVSYENDELLAGSWNRRSLHIFTPFHEFRGSLKDGDKWLAEVLSCSCSLSASTTKDGRVKIRYVVRPLHPLILSGVVFNNEGEAEVWEQCGLNYVTRTKVPYTTRRARFRTNADGTKTVEAVLRSVVIDGHEHKEWVVTGTPSYAKDLAGQIRKQGKKFDLDAYRAHLAALPIPPDSFRKQYPYLF